MLEVKHVHPCGSHGLQALDKRLERVQQLEQHKDALREHYAGIAPEALDSLTPEQRHDFYKLVQLQVVVYPNGDLEIIWAGGPSLYFSNQESVSRYRS